VQTYVCDCHLVVCLGLVEVQQQQQLDFPEPTGPAAKESALLHQLSTIVERNSLSLRLMSDMSPHIPRQSSSPFAAMAAFEWPDSLNSMDSMNSAGSPHAPEDSRLLVSDSQPAEEGLSGLISPSKKQLRVKLPVNSRRSVSWGASPVDKPSLDRRSCQLPSPDYSCFQVCNMSFLWEPWQMASMLSRVLLSSWTTFAALS
jgi:hypothetical protein